MCVCAQTLGQSLTSKVDWPDRVFPIISEKAVSVPFAYLELLEDKSGKMSFQEVSSGLYKEKFKSYTDFDRNHNHTYWGRFAIHNQTNQFLEWKYYVGFNNFIKVQCSSIFSRA